MTPQEFLELVWPAQGWYCIAVPQGKGFHHITFDSIEAAAKKAAELSATKDVYFATHVLEQEKAWDAKKEKWTWRTQANMRASRILFLDLDVGDDEIKKFSSQRDALGSLRQFVSAVNLPIPMCVSSGYGMHIYWILDRELPSATEWLTLATKLKQLAFAHNFKIDTSRVVDTTSILRIVGTFNHKRSDRKPVELLRQTIIVSVDELNAKLDAALLTMNLQPAIPKLDDLGSNVDNAYDGRVPTPGEVLKACAQMKRIFLVHGAGYWEPAWYQSLCVAKFTAPTKHGDWRAFGHALSSGHTGYNPSECEAKMDQVEEQAPAPTSCEVLRDRCGYEHDVLCGTCPFAGKVKNPCVAANYLFRQELLESEAAEPPKITIETVLASGQVHIEEVEVLNPPSPYRRAKNGGIEIMVEDDKGATSWQPVYPYELYPLKRSSAGNVEYQIWHTKNPKEGDKNFVIEADDFADNVRLVKVLMNNGVYPPKNFERFRNYMNSYIRHLVENQGASIQYPTLGWVRDFTEFVLPDQVMEPRGKVRACELTRSAQETIPRYIGVKGTRDDQIRLLRYYDGDIRAQLYICLGVGSLLLHATGFYGLVVNAYGKSGQGKSQLLSTIAGFFGHPDRWVINMTTGGVTAIGAQEIRTVLGNLPTCLDEITELKGSQVRTMALGVSQPTGRVRAKQTGGIIRRDNSEELNRSAILMATSNRSMHGIMESENVAGTASNVRIWEMYFELKSDTQKADWNAHQRELKQHYGHLGPLIIRAIVDHKEVFEKRVVWVMDDLANKHHARTSERFWFAALACAIVICETLTSMGIVAWDSKELERYACEIELPRQRDIVVREQITNAPITILTDFLNDKHGNMLIKGGPAELSVERAPFGSLLIHVEKPKIYVLKQAFKEYCNRRGQYSDDVLLALFRDGVVTHTMVRRTLGQGTAHGGGGRATCFIIDMNHPKLADLDLTIDKNAEASQGNASGTEDDDA